MCVVTRLVEVKNAAFARQRLREVAMELVMLLSLRCGLRSIRPTLELNKRTNVRLHAAVFMAL